MNKLKIAKNQYVKEKAKYAYSLFQKGLPFKKVYAVVEKNGKYVVLQTAKPSAKFKYFLAGGGVDEGEGNITAIKREVLEELNMNIEVVKSFGVIRYVRTWKYEGKVFDISYIAEIFLTKFVSYGKNKKLGLDGEFTFISKGIAIIDKQELINNIECFVNHEVKFE